MPYQPNVVSRDPQNHPSLFQEDHPCSCRACPEGRTARAAGRLPATSWSPQSDGDTQALRQVPRAARLDGHPETRAVAMKSESPRDQLRGLRVNSLRVTGLSGGGPGELEPLGVT